MATTAANSSFVVRAVVGVGSSFARFRGRVFAATHISAIVTRQSLSVVKDHAMTKEKANRLIHCDERTLDAFKLGHVDWISAMCK